MLVLQEAVLELGLAYKCMSTCLQLANEQFDAHSVSVSPNPTSADFVINGKNLFHDGGFVKVYDVLGKLMITNKIQEEESEITVSLRGFSPGLYIVKITDGQNQVLHTQKIIKN